MSLTVKAFLLKKDAPNPEIRRVAIPADVTSSYEYLFKKISDIFVSLRSENFSLYWKGKLAFFRAWVALGFNDNFRIFSIDWGREFILKFIGRKCIFF